MLGTKTKEQVLNLFPQHTILTAYRGSVAHGMYVPNTDPHSIDDIDLFGVHMAPIDCYLGLLQHKDYYEPVVGKYKETVEGFYDEYDVVSYEFKKLMRMLIKSNPNVLLLLSLEAEHYINITGAGKLLLKHREAFFSQKAYYSFARYAENQLKKMTHFVFEGYMGEKRKALVTKFGYDTKNAAHCIRLLRTCIEFLTTGELNVFRSEDAEELLQIKLGQRSLESIEVEAKDLIIKATYAKNHSVLPEVPDYAKINLITKQIVYDYIVNEAVGVYVF